MLIFLIAAWIVLDVPPMISFYFDIRVFSAGMVYSIFLFLCLIELAGCLPMVRFDEK
jgi:hypothetical protein